MEACKTRYPDLRFHIAGGGPSEPPTQEAKEERWPKRSICTPFRQAISFLGDGRVIFYEEMPRSDFIVGDLTTQSIRELWDSPIVDRWLFPPRGKFAGAPCFDCPEFDECHQFQGWCLRDAMKAYGAAFTAPQECPRQRAPGLRLT